ncbi:rod shape-determining protein RodA [Savagea sp. SN6]|uniref:Rod shape-determining protein RodA n=1 Tax=Savagea serpentis TaxID=2785297 RepID=A0A8J7GCI0_9BACL|nr:FtsW/RodA/SpoVE family cell cycle protein [Savagea serpentis]MBF4501156.1 rod shape-determining protein RodA [Savagea serpentis]
MSLQDKKDTFFNRFDWKLALIIIALAIVSVIAISSAQTSGQYLTNFALKQVVWFVVGFILIGMTLVLEPEQYKKIAWFTLLFGLVLLALVKWGPGGPGTGLAPIYNGAKRWLNLPVIGRIQPSEFVKIFYILVIARVVSKHHENTSIKTIQTDFILLLKILGILALPLFFIINQDLGTSLVFLAITLGVIVVSGISWKLLAPLFVGGAALGATVLWMSVYAQDFLREKVGLDEFRMKRVYSWLDPYSYPSNEGFNLIQTMTGIGSGELFGKGYKGREVYVPENHTDFIFSIIGEEYGFIGSSLVIILFFILIYHLTKISLSLNDPFSIYITTGVISMIAFHVIENIGMNIQLLPITGIPLPFISFGGSSIFSMSIAVGLVFSIRYHQRTYMFSDEDH